MHQKLQSFCQFPCASLKLHKQSSSRRLLRFSTRFKSSSIEEQPEQSYYNVNFFVQTGVCQQVEEVSFSSGARKNCAFAWKRTFRQNCQKRFSYKFYDVLATNEREFTVKSLKFYRKLKTCRKPLKEKNCLINNNFMTSQESDFYNETKDEEVLFHLKITTPPDTEFKSECTTENQQWIKFNTFCSNLGEGGKFD